MNRHLAQLNIATLRHPLDDPRTAEFVDALPLVNGAGEQSPGYVWRLQSDSGNATDIRVFDDPLMIVNLTVWESLDALKAFAYRGVHREFFRRRSEWFVDGASRTALWWIAAGSLPTTDDAKRRLDFIDAFGLSPYAFVMGRAHAALVVEEVDVADRRARGLVEAVVAGGWEEVAERADALVVAHLDDLPGAFGAVRRFDPTTAEVTRIAVAEQARGQRVGAAVVAELEAAAIARGCRRLLLETGPRQQPTVALYERFGYRRRDPWQEHPPGDGATYLEKVLVDEHRRLA